MGERRITDLAVQRAGKRLTQSVGYFLTNTVYLPEQTCKRCKGTIALGGGDLCKPCSNYTGADAADLLGSLIYACRGTGSGRLMRGYKEGRSIPDSEAILLLLLLGLSHNACASKAVGSAFTHWASVPSLQHFDREHPLHRIVDQMPGLPKLQVEVHASEAGKAADKNEARRLNQGHYDVATAIPAGSHVLVIEDTWVSGGHAQSVAVALKNAGADKVSILAIARWLDMDDPRTCRIYHDELKPRPYDSTLCPWLHEPCRPPAPIGKGAGRSPSPSAESGPVSTSHAGLFPSEMWGRPATRCSQHGIELDHLGRCEACTRLMTPPPPDRAPDAKPKSQKKPWWQFW